MNEKGRCLIGKSTTSNQSRHQPCRFEFRLAWEFKDQPCSRRRCRRSEASGETVKPYCDAPSSAERAVDGKASRTMILTSQEQHAVLPKIQTDRGGSLGCRSMIGTTLSHYLVYRGGRGMRTVAAVAARVCRTALRLLVLPFSRLWLWAAMAILRTASQARAAPAVSAKRLFLWGGRPSRRAPGRLLLPASERVSDRSFRARCHHAHPLDLGSNGRRKRARQRHHQGSAGPAALGRRGPWGYPDDGMGDCEDLQLLKRKLLVEEGLPRRAFRMTVVFDEGGDGHAVLMALTDRGALILDNKRNAAWPGTNGLHLLKREGSDGLAWASLVGRLSPVAGDISADLREKAPSSAPATSSNRPAPKGT